MSLFYILAGLVLLVVGGEFLVKSSVALSLKFNISRIVIGMTVVSFATSLPELLVSLNAALDGHPELALSNVVGSNIANLALVLGATAILTPIIVKRISYRLNIPAMLILSALLYWFLHNDLILSFLEGLILFAFLIIFIIILLKNASKSGDIDIDELEEIDDSTAQTKMIKVLLWLVIGGVALWYGADLLVLGATELALKLGISEGIIGVSLVAIGTSIPELAASIISALKKEKDLSFGNLVGSNIFNIGSVLGLTAMVKPIHITETKLIDVDILWMLGISALIIPLAMLPKRHKISWAKGLVYLSLYIIFIYFFVFKTIQA
jgi:cation:H+ antiporter